MSKFSRFVTVFVALTASVSALRDKASPTPAPVSGLILEAGKIRKVLEIDDRPGLFEPGRIPLVHIYGFADPDSGALIFKCIARNGKTLYFREEGILGVFSAGNEFEKLVYLDDLLRQSGVNFGPFISEVRVVDLLWDGENEVIALLANRENQSKVLIRYDFVREVVVRSRTFPETNVVTLGSKYFDKRFLLRVGDNRGRSQISLLDDELNSVFDLPDDVINNSAETREQIGKIDFHHDSAYDAIVLSTYRWDNGPHFAIHFWLRTDRGVQYRKEELGKDQFAGVEGTDQLRAAITPSGDIYFPAVVNLRCLIQSPSRFIQEGFTTAKKGTYDECRRISDAIQQGWPYNEAFYGFHMDGERWASEVAERAGAGLGAPPLPWKRAPFKSLYPSFQQPESILVDIPSGKYLVFPGAYLYNEEHHYVGNLSEEGILTDDKLIQGADGRIYRINPLTGNSVEVKPLFGKHKATGISPFEPDGDMIRVTNDHTLLVIRKRTEAQYQMTEDSTESPATWQFKFGARVKDVQLDYAGRVIYLTEDMRIGARTPEKVLWEYPLDAYSLALTGGNLKAHQDSEAKCKSPRPLLKPGEFSLYADGGGGVVLRGTYVECYLPAAIDSPTSYTWGNWRFTARMHKDGASVYFENLPLWRMSELEQQH